MFCIFLLIWVCFCCCCCRSSINIQNALAGVQSKHSFFCLLPDHTSEQSISRRFCLRPVCSRCCGYWKTHMLLAQKQWFLLPLCRGRRPLDLLPDSPQRSHSHCELDKWYWEAVAVHNWVRGLLRLGWRLSIWVLVLLCTWILLPDLQMTFFLQVCLCNMARVVPVICLHTSILI